MMQANGYGADIEFDGHTVTITGRGLGKAALGGPRRDFPVADLVSIEFKAASALINGCLELVTDEGKTLVHFRRKQSGDMEAVYQEICSTVSDVSQGKMGAVSVDAGAKREIEDESPTTAPPGWYQDPSGAKRLRYWNGVAWTEHFAESEVVEHASGDSNEELALRNDFVQSDAEYRPSKAELPGRPILPWSEKLEALQVVGESFHESEFKLLARAYGHEKIPRNGIELHDCRAALVREVDNPYDSNAIAVWVDARYQVGHLDRDSARKYAARLDQLEVGTFLQVPARVWIGPVTDWDEDLEEGITKIVGSVTVRLPDPEGVMPYNELPVIPYAVLPWGRVVQIAGEEAHMDVLRTMSLGEAPRHVAVTLHVVEDPRRSGGSNPLVEVRLDGSRIGEMSKAMSAQLHDLVTYVTDRGRVPVARATIRGSDLRVEVVVNVARTVDVPQAWLDAVHS